MVVVVCKPILVFRLSLGQAEQFVAPAPGTHIPRSGGFILRNKNRQYCTFLKVEEEHFLKDNTQQLLLNQRDSLQQQTSRICVYGLDRE